MSWVSDEKIERIAVVRALPGVGDFLCAVPALRALRSAFPKAAITLIGLSSTQPLVSRFGHYVDELLPFPGFPGIPEEPVDVGRLPGFLAEAQARRFDLALQMHGSGSVINPFALRLGARISAGFYPFGTYCPDPQRFFPLPEELHEVHRWLYLLARLGISSCDSSLEFPLEHADWDSLGKVEAAAHLLRDEYVVVHPGASAPERRWASENFAEVADSLAARGYRVVLTGTRAESEVATAVARMMHRPPLNLAGSTTLGAMAALLSRASLLVTNDTGVSHLSAALRVPSAVVFVASEAYRWAPLDSKLHRVVDAGQAVGWLTVETVLQEADALLRELVEVVRA